MVSPVESVKVRFNNAKDWGKPFTARLLEPGMVSYEDSNCGKVLLRKETLDRCINSFVGRPIVVKKTKTGSYVHTKTSPENMKAIGHGYVTDVFYNSVDGWWYGKGVVDTDDAVKAIKDVGFCSTGYAVNRTGPGGTWHDCAYDEEILDFSGEHLAVVDNPRYEDATIRLNSKQNKMNVLKWFPKLASPSKAEGEDAAKAAAAKKAADDKAAAEAASLLNSKNGEAVDITAETTFDIPGVVDGEKETISLASLISDHHAIENAKKNGVDMSGDDDICVNGKTYKVNALVEAFDKWEKVNSSEKKENKVVDDLGGDEGLRERKNAKGKNGNHFNVLLNANAKEQVIERGPMNTLEERLANGRASFGTIKK